MGRSSLLNIDAAINFFLGILLLLTIPFPRQIPQFFGVPAAEHPFYASILGAVLVGIGIALIMEGKRTDLGQFVGLGLGGAVAINLCGGAVLIGWLVFGDLQLPFGGKVFLWAVGLLLITISGYELLIHTRKISTT
jgi:hypothetical protein